MNGAEALMRAARAAGADLCLANPGTTEMQLVSALDAVGGLRTVLALFEGVCTGAADGYGRMTGRPALTLLHLGPGLANGLANLHNARRARSPVVNLVGEHATWHRAADAPLTADIEGMAATVGSVRTAREAGALAADLRAVMGDALGLPAGVATLVVPQDLAWTELPAAAADAAPAALARRGGPARDLEPAAAALRRGPASVLYLGGRALGARGLRAAARIAAATGCRVFHETLPARIERGAGLPAFPRLLYFPEAAAAMLAGASDLVCVGAPEPVAFFGYPNTPSRTAPPDCRVLPLGGPGDDAEATLIALAEVIGGAGAPESARARPERPTGALDADALCRAVAALQPEGAIVVDEGATTSGPTYFEHAAGAPPHSVLTLTGGAIGQGLPCAVGAALACPDRRVIALQADGSGMYTLQSLWTMARESLDVTVVVCANRAYRILQFELARAGVMEPGPRARSLTDLSHPELDWVALARGMGVPGSRPETADEVVTALAGALATLGPALIEVRI